VRGPPASAGPTTARKAVNSLGRCRPLDRVVREAKFRPMPILRKTPWIWDAILHPVGVAAGLLAFHAILLAWLAVANSPVFNEVGHLPAGISHWRYGIFHLYRVNPPLPRMLAAFPVLFLDHRTDWTNYGMTPFSREEIPMAIRFAKANRADVFRLFTTARWACILFCLIGAWMCYRWATELWGQASGLIACTLWCFSPAILGNGALVMPDTSAAALGLAATYLFWRWLQQATWARAFWAGIVLGLAELCKTTHLAFLIVWPVLWLVSRLLSRSLRPMQPWLYEIAMIGTMILVAMYILDLGYGFHGSFRRLGDFQFLSQLFGGRHDATVTTPGNRFAKTWLGDVPVPVPADYLQGIDRQQADFELGSRSYLCGEWQERGWWYYYLYALAIKTPLGTWVLFLLAVSASCVTRGYSVSCRDEMALLLPASAILLLVSSQTGFSIHSRYVLPILPFGFVWISKVGRCIQLRHWRVAAVAGIALYWSVGSSLWCYPHSLSYFNELVGGPKNGHNHLLDSNIAWGQDLLFLRNWLDAHPEAQPISLASYGWTHPELAGISFDLPPLGPRNPGDVARIDALEKVGPRPGWYAVDVNFLHGTHWAAASPGYCWAKIHTDDLNLEYFLRFQPVAMAGYSIYIYHIAIDEANRVRRELGLPELPSDWKPTDDNAGT